MDDKLDILQLLSKVNQSKKEILITETPKQMTNLLYLIDCENIVYMTKTQNVELWLFQNAKKYFATHYYSEEISSDVADNILATLIINLQPIHNKSLPQNSTKYISKEIASKRYRIRKTEFNKICKEVPYLTFNGTPYIEKQILDDLFGGIKKYDIGMPKLNQEIIPIGFARYCDLISSEIREQTFDRVDGENYVEQTIVDRYIKKSKSKIEEDLKTILENTFVVTSLLSENTFEATHPSLGKRVVHMDEYNREWHKIDYEYVCACTDFLKMN